MHNLTPVQSSARALRGHSESDRGTPMKTILYVEDDEHDVFFFKRAFTGQAPAIRVQNVHSIEEAKDYLKGVGSYAERSQFPLPDLVVSDVSIPGGSGYQLLRWVRENSEFARLPFILLSGSTQEIAAEKMSGGAADYCVEKSVDFKELLAKVRKLLSSD